MSKHILITGATGFIGRHLARELRRLGHSVSCLVRAPERAGFLREAGCTLIRGDITDTRSLEAIGRAHFDAVYHCAAYVNNKHPRLLQTTNVEGTRNICAFALSRDAGRLIYVSSVAVVSANEAVPLTENLPYRATNLYGASKIAAEQEAINYRNNGLPMVILRPPMIYGEGEPHLMGAIVRFVRWRLIPASVLSDAPVHMAYVQNVAAALVFALDSNELLHGTFFVADKEYLSSREIVAVIQKSVGARPSPAALEWISRRLLRLPLVQRHLSMMLKDRVYSTQRIEKAGFTPPFSARESLAKSAAWFKEHAHGT